MPEMNMLLAESDDIDLPDDFLNEIDS